MAYIDGDGGGMSSDSAIGEWIEKAYEDRSVSWESAAQRVKTWILNQRRRLLDGQDASRVEVSCYRIKDAERAADKLRRRVASDPWTAVPSCVSDVEELLHDLVGVKVLCKSPRDQRLIFEALTDEQCLDTFELVEQKDYACTPKPSGYRACHVILRVPVEGQAAVYTEVQVKTRLQDAWGELTHEDMYKPGAAMNPSAFHEAVARTMAALLSQVDELADDLAEELVSATNPDPAATKDCPTATIGDPNPAVATDVRVRRTGPRYALAVDGNGRQGLIPAYAVRDLIHAKDMINVDDYIHLRDLIPVDVVEDDDGVFYLPRELASAAKGN